jgi:hypothetical protein
MTGVEKAKIKLGITWFDRRIKGIIRLANERMARGENRHKTLAGEALHLCNNSSEVDGVMKVLK